MRKLLIPFNDVGYFFLLLDMALIADNHEQLDFEFEDEIDGNIEGENFDEYQFSGIL